MPQESLEGIVAGLDVLIRARYLNRPGFPGDSFR
jgi:hypothetical protein